MRARLPIAMLTLAVCLGALRTADAASDIQPRGPGQLPRQLCGRWELGMCVVGDHAYLRLQSLETCEVHTLSRIRKGWGGQRNEATGEWTSPPAEISGVNWDQELAADRKRHGRSHILRSVILANPCVYWGIDDGWGYSAISNNCATYVRDGWEFYTGEHYRLLCPHLPTDLKHDVLLQTGMGVGGPRATQRLESSFVPPSPNGSPLDSFSECPREERWYDGTFAWARVGGLTVGSSLANGDAFNEAVGVGVPIAADRLYAIGGFESAQDASTQCLSSAGLAWMPDLWCDHSLDRFGANVLFQNYDDSRFDGANLSRTRLDLYYAFSPGMHVGSFWYSPVGEADVEIGDVLAPATIDTQMSEYAGLYISRDVAKLSLAVRLGYGDEPDALRYGGSIGLHLRENVSVYTSTDAHEHDGWAAVAGLQYEFGCRAQTVGGIVSRGGPSSDVVRGGAVMASSAPLLANKAESVTGQREAEPVGESEARTKRKVAALLSNLGEASINSGTLGPGLR